MLCNPAGEKPAKHLQTRGTGAPLSCSRWPCCVTVAQRARGCWFLWFMPCHALLYHDAYLWEIVIYSLFSCSRTTEQNHDMIEKGDDQGRSWKDVQIACLQPCFWSSSTNNSAYELLCCFPIVHRTGFGVLQASRHVLVRSDLVLVWRCASQSQSLVDHLCCVLVFVATHIIAVCRLKVLQNISMYVYCV